MAHGRFRSALFEDVSSAGDGRKLKIVAPGCEYSESPLLSGEDLCSRGCGRAGDVTERRGGLGVAGDVAIGKGGWRMEWDGGH